MSDRILTPQQELFIASYTDPKSDTFSNAYQSALKAGYTESVSNSITSSMPEWLYENICDAKLITKATRNVDKFLNDEDNKHLQADMTKFVLERLNKKKFSLRTELTGADGKDLPQPIYGGKSTDTTESVNSG